MPPDPPGRRPGKGAGPGEEVPPGALGPLPPKRRAPLRPRQAGRAGRRRCRCGAFELAVVASLGVMSWQAFIPVTFEVSVLMGAVGALVGMLFINRLPQLYHSLFRSERFERSTDDKFFISIEARDPKFDAEGTAKFLEGIGSKHVELVED